MMKLWEKFRNSLHPDDEEGVFDDEFDDDYPVNGNINNSGSLGGDMGDFMGGMGGGYSSGNPYGNSNQNVNSSTPQNNNYQPVQTSAAPVGGISVSGGLDRQSSVEIKVVKPENFDSVANIANLLISKKTVVLNLEETNKEIARRLLDFLAGTAYAIGGQRRKVSEKTYIITPNNATVSDEEIRREENGEKRDNNLY